MDANAPPALAAATERPRRLSFHSYTRAIEKTRRLDGIEPTVFGCLRKDGRIRGALVWLMMWSGTDAIIGFAVVLLSCALCAFDPVDRWSSANQTIAAISFYVTLLFALELLVKVLALGLFGRTGYFSDPWNWLDTIVVLYGLASIDPVVNYYSSLRLLRLVRWMTGFPGMRVVLRAGFRAIPGFLSVLMLTSLTYIVWGLVAVQLWAGVLSVRARAVVFVIGSCYLLLLAQGNCFYEDPDTSAKLPDPSGAFCALQCDRFERSCPPTWGDACPAIQALNSTSGSMQSVPMTW